MTTPAHLARPRQPATAAPKARRVPTRLVHLPVPAQEFFRSCIAEPRTITSASNGEPMQPGTYMTPAVRPGADDALAKPSRTGDRLAYRNGKVTTLDGVEL